MNDSSHVKICDECGYYPCICYRGVSNASFVMKSCPYCFSNPCICEKGSVSMPYAMKFVQEDKQDKIIRLLEEIKKLIGEK